MTRDVAGIALFALAVVALTAWLQSGVWLNALMMTLYAALLALAWHLLGGFGGQFSFGHALFFGTGAYASAIASAADVPSSNSEALAISKPVRSMTIV